MTGLLLAAVLVTNVTWQDAARHREIPAKIYAPAEVPKPVPVIIFSHGLGGTRDGYEYLGRHWAEHGYISVHLQHHGSDRAALWDNRPQEIALDPANWRNRALDVRYAIDQMVRDSRVNTNAIGMAGHSFGAQTTLVVIGQRVAGQSLADPRVKAAIALSSPRPVSGEAFRDVRTPCLHLTGTKDDSPIFHITAKDRRFAFDHIRASPQFLISLPDATHMTFAGIGQADHLHIICEATTEFWDAFLKGDKAAGAKLLQTPAAVEAK